MKKLDAFILKKFMRTFFFILGTIMLIAIIFDISEKIDDFMEEDAPISEIVLDYYVNFVLYYGNLFSALLIFIAVIFFTSKMASNTEIVAILSGGVSFYRMLLPYFIGATILAALSLYLSHYAIPEANKQRLSFEEKYFRSPFRNRDKNIHRVFDEGQIMYFESYNVLRKTGYKFSLEQWDDDRLKYKLMADYATYDTAREHWSVFNYQERFIDTRGIETIKKGARLDSAYSFLPKNFSTRISHSIQMMNTKELNTFIASEMRLGSKNIPDYLIEKHGRTAYPMASYILTIIGVAISSRKVRGGLGLHLAWGLLLAVTYILLMKVTTVFAINANLSPLLSVWIPNIFFAGVAIVLLIRAPK